MEKRLVCESWNAKNPFSFGFLPQENNMETQNIIPNPSLRSEDIAEIKNTFIVFAGSEDGTG